MSDKLSAVVLMGMPGIGKGTLASTIQKSYVGVEHVNSSALAKSIFLPDGKHSQRQKELQKEVKEIWNQNGYTMEMFARGEFFPQGMLLDLVDCFLSSDNSEYSRDPDTSLWLLDGLPRTQFQVDYVLDMFSVEHVLMLGEPGVDSLYVLSDERMKTRGRSSDSSIAGRKQRLMDHRQYTEPAMRTLLESRLRTDVIDPSKSRYDVAMQAIRHLSRNDSLSAWFDPSKTYKKVA